MGGSLHRGTHEVATVKRKSVADKTCSRAMFQWEARRYDASLRHGRSRHGNQFSPLLWSVAVQRYADRPKKLILEPNLD